MALQKVEESKKARLKAKADANNAKEKLMKIEEEAKENMEALAKQRESLEEQARASVLAKREEASSTIKGLIGSTPQITNAKGAIDNLKGDVGTEANKLMKGYSNLIKTNASNKTDGFAKIFNPK
jgi:predicted flap endonuclease-1-like 5' DNA nuclease